MVQSTAEPVTTVPITASGASLLARPGSLSRASCTRSSLTRSVVSVELRVVEPVSLFTRLSPECSSALNGPLFSLFLPLH